MRCSGVLALARGAKDLQHRKEGKKQGGKESKGRPPKRRQDPSCPPPALRPENSTSIVYPAAVASAIDRFTPLIISRDHGRHLTSHPAAATTCAIHLGHSPAYTTIPWMNMNMNPSVTGKKAIPWISAWGSPTTSSSGWLQKAGNRGQARRAPRMARWQNQGQQQLYRHFIKSAKRSRVWQQLMCKRCTIIYQGVSKERSPYSNTAIADFCSLVTI